MPKLYQTERRGYSGFVSRCQLVPDFSCNTTIYYNPAFEINNSSSAQVLCKHKNNSCNQNISTIEILNRIPVLYLPQSCSVVSQMTELNEQCDSTKILIDPNLDEFDAERETKLFQVNTEHVNETGSDNKKKHINKAICTKKKMSESFYYDDFSLLSEEDSNDDECQIETLIKSKGLCPHFVVPVYYKPESLYNIQRNHSSTYEGTNRISNNVLHKIYGSGYFNNNRQVNQSNLKGQTHSAIMSSLLRPIGSYYSSCNNKCSKNVINYAKLTHGALKKIDNCPSKPKQTTNNNALESQNPTRYNNNSNSPTFEMTATNSINAQCVHNDKISSQTTSVQNQLASSATSLELQIQNLNKRIDNSSLLNKLTFSNKMALDSLQSMQCRKPSCAIDKVNKSPQNGYQDELQHNINPCISQNKCWNSRNPIVAQNVVCVRSSENEAKTVNNVKNAKTLKNDCKPDKQQRQNQVLNTNSKSKDIKAPQNIYRSQYHADLDYIMSSIQQLENTLDEQKKRLEKTEEMIATKSGMKPIESYENKNDMDKVDPDKYASAISESRVLRYVKAGYPKQPALVTLYKNNSRRHPSRRFIESHYCSLLETSSTCTIDDFLKRMKDKSKCPNSLQKTKLKTTTDNRKNTFQLKKLHPTPTNYNKGCKRKFPNLNIITSRKENDKACAAVSESSFFQNLKLNFWIAKNMKGLSPLECRPRSCQGLQTRTKSGKRYQLREFSSSYSLSSHQLEDEPKLPYYVVPVLYVPKRIVSNEEWIVPLSPIKNAVIDDKPCDKFITSGRLYKTNSNLRELSESEMKIYKKLMATMYGFSLEDINNYKDNFSKYRYNSFRQNYCDNKQNYSNTNISCSGFKGIARYTSTKTKWPAFTPMAGIETTIPKMSHHSLPRKRSCAFQTQKDNNLFKKHPVHNTISLLDNRRDFVIRNTSSKASSTKTAEKYQSDTKSTQTKNHPTASTQTIKSIRCKTKANYQCELVQQTDISTT